VFVSLHSWIRETIVGLSGTVREIGQAIGSITFRVLFMIVGAKVVKFVAKSLADLKRAVTNSSWYQNATNVARNAVNTATGTIIIPAKRLSSLARNVQESFMKYRQNNWSGNVPGQTPGTRAGGIFRNADSRLPTRDFRGRTITYREFDVNNKIQGMRRDAQRFVVGSDGSVYFTADHYRTFIRILE